MRKFFILCYSFIFSHQLGASVLSLDLSSSTNSKIWIDVFPLLLLFFLIVWNKKNSPILFPLQLSFKQTCQCFIVIPNIIKFVVYRDRFPYFKAEDERWKNSVRHNLSMNPHFRKGNKAKHGSGHLWVLADLDDQEDDLTIKV